MSSTNRGGQRAERDFYETPEWLTEAILPHIVGHLDQLDMSPVNVLETSAGNGKIVRVVEGFLRNKGREQDLGFSTTMYDIHPGPEIEDRCIKQDFLSVEQRPDYHLIVQNPPFTHNREFVEHALGFLHKEQPSVFASMTRIGLLGSQKRAEWWRTYRPHEIHLTPRRPKFRGNGNDSEEFVWLVWYGPLPKQPPDCSRFYWLRTEQEKWRRKL